MKGAKGPVLYSPFFVNERRQQQNCQQAAGPTEKPPVSLATVSCTDSRASGSGNNNHCSTHTPSGVSS